MSERQEKTQDEKIIDLQTNIKNLFWAIGIIVTLFMGIGAWRISAASRLEDNFNLLRVDTNQRLEPVTAQYIEIKAQLSQIQTDILWIKKELNNK